MNVCEVKLKEVNQKLEDLFQIYWNDDYLVDLSVVDHCREVVQLWDKNKSTKSHSEEFEKETSDLLILLLLKNMVVDINNSGVDFDFDLILERLDKFQSKLKKKGEHNEI